jgi:hypothetical protein
MGFKERGSFEGCNEAVARPPIEKENLLTT